MRKLCELAVGSKNISFFETNVRSNEDVGAQCSEGGKVCELLFFVFVGNFIGASNFLTRGIMFVCSNSNFCPFCV